ncbi:MAG: DUF58 domain-containing protein [Planctomycetaceae bacterium]|nr:DUF58 domain-containing protein [Planctomycetaceae bacterium]
MRTHPIEESPLSQTPELSYPPPSFIDPPTLMRIRSLEMRAKAVVEGFLSGLHRSPYFGFSVEFSEYRQYVVGDDPRYLDWKLFARSDRYYIKRFEDETNLRCHLIVDNSTSMEYGSLHYNKSDYAKTLAATLAYFLARQRDAVGLFLFSEGLDEQIPARFRPGHLRRLLLSLEHAPTGTSTGIASAIGEAAARVRKRGLFAIVSDFLVPLDDLEKQLGYLRAGRNQICLFQILDPAECDFPFDEATLFVDAETGQEVYVDPREARESYRQRFNAHNTALAEMSGRLGLDYVTLTTDTPLELALYEFLKLGAQTPSSLAGSRSTGGRR